MRPSSAGASAPIDQRDTQPATARRASHWSRSGERGSDQVIQCSLGLAGCDDEAQVCRHDRRVAHSLAEREV